MFLNSFRSAARELQRAPITLAAVVLSLSLGIAASTVMFTLIYSVLYRPLPYPDSARVRSLGQYSGGAMRGWNEPIEDIDALVKGSSGDHALHPSIPVG